MKDLPIIIISGLPGTGKTTLGKSLAEKLKLPFISRDGIKELLFDNLGWSNRAWSRKLGLASCDLLYYFAKVQLSARRPFIIESNFKPEFDTEKFLKLKEQFQFSPIQVICRTEGKVLMKRFKTRAESHERHPGHVDTSNYQEFEEMLLKGRQDPLEIGGKIIEVDTTDFSAVDYESLSRGLKEICLSTSSHCGS